EIVTNLEVTPVTGKANLKIIHASPYTINYSAQLKVNDVRVSNNIINATPFPGGGLNTQGSNMPWYLALTPGSTKISLSVPKAGTIVDSIPLYTGTINIESNKYYSAYLTDTGTNTQTVLVTENLTPVASGVSRFKFVNLIPNQTALDLYFGTEKVASNVAYKATSPEFTILRSTSSQFSIRAAGAASTATALTIYPTGTTNLVIPNMRIMTVFARGYSAGTANRAPAISLLYN
ncbi:MAG TPA: DUF4397 domain-containing protein, partial [Segetibacter sp.]